MTTPQVNNKPNLNISSSLISKKLATFPKQFIQFNPKIRSNTQLTSNKKPPTTNSYQSKQLQNELKLDNEKNPNILNNTKKLFDVSFKPSSSKGLFQITSNNDKDNLIQNKPKSNIKQENSIENQHQTEISISKKRPPIIDNGVQIDLNIFTKKFKSLTSERSSEEKINKFIYPDSQENNSSLDESRSNPPNSLNHHNQSQKNIISQTESSNYSLGSQKSFINDETELSDDDEYNVDEIQEFFVQHTGKLASSLEELASEMEECKDNLDELSVKLLMINNEILLMNNPMLHDEKTKNVDKIIQRFYEE